METTAIINVIACLLLTWGAVWCDNDLIGLGKWTVLNIVKCPDQKNYEIDFEISRKKVNRSHDGFSGNMKNVQTIDSNYGVIIDICKYVDGGCKPFQVVKDDDFCTFLKKYAEANMEKLLRMAGVDPPDCPIPKGDYKINNFVFDYYELPEKGLYGKYDAKTMMTTKDEFYEKVMGCLIVTLTFEKDDRDEE